jgi:6-phosphogluconate dehydrogenase
MGAGIARRLEDGGHEVVGFDADQAVRQSVAAKGTGVATSIPDLVGKLQPDPVVWIMVPCGAPVDQTIGELASCTPLPATLIDGGNSNYKDTMRRHDELTRRGVGFVDVGTSGGVRGESDGYCLMIGGESRVVEPLSPLFSSLAPSAERGWGHVGPPGAGHFVKMMHNGIEYGMMQALAEGFAVLESRGEFDLDLARIASIWNDGSVIRSWLLELAGAVLARDPGLEGIRSEVDDSGEGRWAVAEAIDLNVATPVITHALIARIQSRDPRAFSNKILSALRHEFGGHASDTGNR